MLSWQPGAEHVTCYAFLNRNVDVVLVWTILGTVFIMAGVTAFWSKIGPAVLAPHDGTEKYTTESSAKVLKPFVLIMGVVTLVLIVIDVAILG